MSQQLSVRQKRPLIIGHEYATFYRGKKIIGELLEDSDEFCVIKCFHVEVMYGIAISKIGMIVKREWLFELSEINTILN